MKRSVKAGTWGLALIAALGTMALWFAITPGIGLNPDSVQYLDSAFHIARGQGYVTPLYNYQHPLPVADYISQVRQPEGLALRPQTQYPPLFPLVLAPLTAAGDRGLRWIGFLFSLLFGLNIYLAGRFTGRMTCETNGLMILSGILVFASEGMLEVHTTVFSEPLFLTLLWGTLLALVSYADHHRPVALVLAASACGAALLTRYAGLALLISGVTGLLYLDRRPWKKRFLAGLIFLTLASLPSLLFMVRNVLLTSSPANRPVGWTPAGLRLLAKLLPALSGWLFPGSRQVPLPAAARIAMTAITAAALLGLAAFLIIWRSRSRATAEPRRPNAAFVQASLFLAAYSAMCLGLVFFDKEMTFDSRILSPLQVVFLTFAVGAVHWASPHFRSLRRWGVAAFVAVAICQSAAAGVWIAVCHNRGRGYNSTIWREPAVREAALAVGRTPDRTPIFSNEPAAIKVLSGRYAYYLPFSLSSPGWSALYDAFPADESAVFLFFRYVDRLVRKGPPEDPAEILASLATQLRITVDRADNHVILFHIGRESR